jgi:murein DD-endopeptidase MepM/ murein hydrolase activator NlpD
VALVAASLFWARRAPLPVAAPVVVDRAYRERVDSIRSGETVSHVFGRQLIAGPELVEVLRAAEGLDPRRVRPGQTFAFRYAIGEDRPDRVTTRLGDERVLTLMRDSTGWHGESVDIVWTPVRSVLRGVIVSSLYLLVHEAIPDSVLPVEERARLVWDLADGVFGWVVDFTRDLRTADTVRVLYERELSSLGDVRYGRILAAQVQTAGSFNQAYLLTSERGGSGYYDEAGQSLRRAFRRYPVESFRRISSGFSNRRFHPVLRTYRAHLGVDYSAPTGTRVVATGNGVVTRAGTWGGYGTMVEIRHPKGILTRYAHLSRLARGLRPGLRVEQGQIIGYAGMTGLATAPHVHYEFIQGGRHVDPRVAVRFGAGDPVPQGRRAEFDRIRAHYASVLSPPAEQRTLAAGID